MTKITIFKIHATKQHWKRFRWICMYGSACKMISKAPFYIDLELNHQFIRFVHALPRREIDYPK